MIVLNYVFGQMTLATTLPTGMCTWCTFNDFAELLHIYVSAKQSSYAYCIVRHSLRNQPQTLTE